MYQTTKVLIYCCVLITDTSMHTTHFVPYQNLHFGTFRDHSHVLDQIQVLR